jgi:hypothetical protein
MEWQPTTVEAVKKIIERDLKDCDDEQVSAFKKYVVEPYRAPILRYGKMESVVVLARRRDEVIYGEDVEGGFNRSPVAPDGRILEHWCNQDELRLALNAWIEGSARTGVVDAKVPVAQAQVTLLPELSHGRRLLNTGQYRPHIVIGPQSQRVAFAAGRALTERYLGVMFVRGPDAMSPGESAEVSLALMYFPEEAYEEVKPGATFTISEIPMISIVLAETSVLERDGSTQNGNGDRPFIETGTSKCDWSVFCCSRRVK